MKPMNLYWVETEDHDEDWFVVASNDRAAARFHERNEGYARGDAQATFIVEVPGRLKARAGWPSEEDLEACGAKILRPDTPRLVEIGGRQFCEGTLEHEIEQISDDAFEARGEGRLNKTAPRTKH